MNEHTPTPRKRSLLQYLWTGLFTLMYPFILVFSFAFVGVVHFFSLLSRLISRFLPISEEKPTTGSVWQPFAQVGELKVEHQMIGEIMFGPAYYRLKANHSVQALSDQYFGDFQFPFQQGLLLQRWNSLEPQQLPDFDLVFLNAKTNILQRVKTIKAFDWRAEESDNQVTLWFGEKKNSESLTIRADDLQENASTAWR